MAITKQLKPDEYSESRKKAMLELKLESQNKQIKNKEGLWKYMEGNK